MPDKDLSQFEFKHTHPLKIFLHIYTGQYLKIILAIIFFTIKHSPVWFLPVVIARIINIISDTSKYSTNDLWMVGGIFFLIIIQNIPMHTLYVRMFSSAVNTMQLNLRSSIIKRLQELSISFHDKYQSGKLQTKVTA